MRNYLALVLILTVIALTSLACQLLPARPESRAEIVQGTPTGAILSSQPTGLPALVNLPAGDIVRRITHAGRERSYRLHIPAALDWSQPVPLVLAFHGGGGNAENMARMSGLDAVADEQGFLVVYPNGTGGKSDERLLTWNAGACCAYAQETGVDDVGFVRAVVAEVQTLANIDPHRMYATGMSNGAMLSYRLACEAADLFAAVAPVAGTLNFSPCQPSEPVSVIAFHGTADQQVPYAGGVGPNSVVQIEFASAQDSVTFWAEFNQCNLQPQPASAGMVKHESWAGCQDATAVALYTILDGGHVWPGGQRGRPGADQPDEGLSASHLIWEFFAAHPKP